MGKSIDRWTIKRGLGAMRRCLDAHEEEERLLKELAVFLESDNDRSLGDIIDTFSHSSAWLSVRGAVAIQKGEPAGWPLVQAGFRRQVLRYVVRFQEHDALKTQGYGASRKPLPYSPFSYLGLNDICLCLLYAIATHEDNCATMLGDCLVRHLQQSDDLFNPSLFEYTPFESFAVLLYCRWKDVRYDAVEEFLSVPPHFSILHSEVYRHVIRAWSSGDSFQEAVAGMVGLRSKWTDHDDEPWPTFPYGVIAVEFLALRRVREEQAMSFRMPEHPMLQTPWATPPEGLERLPNDELWDRVVRRCRYFLPGLVFPPNWEPGQDNT